MRNFRRRASLIAAIGIVTASLTGAPAQAGARGAAGPPTAAATATGAVRASSVPAWSADAHAPAVTKRHDPDGPVCAAPYVNEDQRLGPKNLPKEGVLGRILRGYVPLGGIPPQRFLDRYWNWEAAAYRYPPDFGFGHAGGYSNGRVLVAGMTLRVGEKLDRFGGENGSFLSPLGTPYAERAIPPTNLTTFPTAPQYPCGYHAYRVIREFAVDVGPSAAAFQQPGGGNQYHLVSRYVPEAPQSRDEVSVIWLVDNGYLSRLN
ncbi:TNT domain-containing protein [Sphaerisporangium corydalis]|uniref:TNT domain-containing protein n=1 Tax=Sphaerisporangium corydalis TaxID=1441875 RepID=A0ABV9E8D4_9ACTN|nr:TNT domain-containing protein [Sphaerisporangium corydalis]